jgi:acyl-CoA synthetase (NDP forming)
VVLAMLGEDCEVPAAAVAKLRGLGVPFFRSPERALRALARLATVREPQSLSSAEVHTTTRLPAGVIAEHAAKHLLREVGLPIPRSALVQDLAAAEQAAARIGYPVALKAQSPRLAHKSDAGGVVLGLAEGAALAEGWRKLHAEVANAQPGLELEGVLVEAMARTGLELVVGVRRDPDWGPVLLFGLGGVFAEVLRDIRILPACVDAAAIIDGLRTLKAAALLTGFRGALPLDLAAVADVAVRLGAFAAAHPEIAEIEVNPLMVYPEGALVLDALIVVR